MELSDDENVEDENEDDTEFKTESKAPSKNGNEGAAGKDASSKAPVTIPSTSTSGSSSGLSVGGSSSSEGFSSPTGPSNGAKRKTRSNRSSEPMEKCDKEAREPDQPSSTSSYAICSSGSSTTCTTTNTNTNVLSTFNSSVSDSNIKSECKVTVNGDVSDSEKPPIKTEHDLEAVKLEVKTEFKDEDAKSPPFSTATSSLADDEYRLLMGNNNWYLFLRLHHILCQRLSVMYEHAVRVAAEEVKEKKDRRESTAVALRLKPKNEIAVEDYYPALLDMVQNILDGNLESTAFEDTLREMFGIYAYTAFTLDKVVNGAVRQLQHIVCDELPSQCTSIYLTEARKGSAGGPIASSHRRLHLEQAYQRKIEKLLQDENCFKMFTYKRDMRVTLELIDTDMDESEEQNGNNNNITSTNGGSEKESESEFPISPSPYVHSIIPPAVAEVERWTEYVEKYVTTVAPQVSPAMQAQLCRKPVFLPRNLRALKKEANKRVSSHSQGNTLKVNPHGMEVTDNTQCKFNLSNFKMVFVVNSDSYMYKKEALQRAKQSHEAVSKRMKRGFNAWLEKWSRENVTEAESTKTCSWFMGEIEGLRANKTRVKRIDRPHLPPYLPFNKYECDLPQDNSCS